jgi:hypothetical protein
VQAYLWTLLSGRVEWITDDTLLGQLDTSSDELIVDFRVDEGARASCADLRCVREYGYMSQVHGKVNCARGEEKRTIIHGTRVVPFDLLSASSQMINGDFPPTLERR